MRGKPFTSENGLYSLRITPADAGKTLSLNPTTIRQKDHPRGCGENIITEFSLLRFLGSPPRMRGKLLWQLRQWVFQRITPADAGKTEKEAIVAEVEPDHPRGCGENTKKIL